MSKINRFMKVFGGVVSNPRNIKLYKKKYQFKRSFGKKTSISYIPDVLTLQITFRCNFRCPACLYLLKNPEALTGGNDMSLERINELLDRFQGEIKFVGLSGGEPTLHPQFSEIVKTIKRRGLKLSMSTNGTLITQKIDDLKHFDKINISLDGADYQAFTKLRNGTEQQYKDIINGLHLLRDANINFNISFLLFEENLQEISKILALAREIKPTVLNLHSGNPHGSKNFTPLLINSPKVQNFLKEVLKKNDYPFSIKLPTIFDPNSKIFKEHACPALWSYSYVGWNGDIAYCCHLKPDSNIGNMFQEYDFNSSSMVNFRKIMVEHKFPQDCLYCQRRFVDISSGYFDGKIKKWNTPEIYKEYKL